MSRSISHGLDRALESMDLHSNIAADRLAQYLQDQDDQHRQRAQRLADELLSRKAVRKRKVITDRQKRHKLQEKRTIHERRQARRKGFPRGPPKKRCYDWMIHEGDIHYARNGSSFTAYTKIDATACHIPGYGEEYRAIGIGTVKLTASRAPDCASLCEITLHDVLHIPAMPCNGISESKMKEAGLQVVGGRCGPAVLGTDGVELFCGSMLHMFYRRVALSGLPEGECPLDEDGAPIPISLSSTNPRRVMELGSAARLIKDLRRRLGYRLLETNCEVEC